MATHTTCCQAAGRVLTPHGVAADGPAPGCGAAGPPTGGGATGVPMGRSGLRGGGGGAGPSTTSLGPIVRASRLASRTGRVEVVVKASDTVAPGPTRWVTSIVFQFRPRRGPEATERGPVRGAVRNVSARSLHGRSEA